MMKEHIFKIIIFSLLFVLMGTTFHYYSEFEDLQSEVEVLRGELEEKRDKLEGEEAEFDKNFVKNSKFNSYCPVSLEDGKRTIDNISEFCRDENLPPRDLEISLSLLEVKEEEAIGVLLSEVDDLEETVELVAFSKIGGHYASKRLEEKPLSLEWHEDFIAAEFKEEKVRYRLIGNEFEKIEEDYKKVSSPDSGFSVKIPANWDVKKDGVSYLFGPAHKNLHFLRLKTDEFKFIASENNPYELEKAKMESSLKTKELERLADYGKFEEALDNYLRINTTEGVIDYFKEGVRKERFDILASGDPTGWNGTPAGLYEIYSKEGLRFSTESGVYMPYSMRLYGKYLIHGEAYFPSGVPYESAVSGGCVRVRDKEMSDLYEMAETGDPVLSITHQKSEFDHQQVGMPGLPDLQSESFLVADLESGKVFMDKNPTERRSIASITKLMTATVVAEQIGQETTLTVRDYMLDGYGETEGLYEGRKVKMVDLLRPLLIESSNDAAIVLAHFLGRDNTLDSMNQKANSIGMENSEFVEASGIDEENISTARDIYYMLYYLWNARRPILKITAEEQVTGVNYRSFTGLKNRISFYDHEDFLGGKTGYIPESDYGGGFVFEVDFNGSSREVAFILLGSPSRQQLEREVFELKNWLEKAYN